MRGVSIASAAWSFAQSGRAAAAEQIPIIFNDRHADVRPTNIRAGRVLGAIARGDALLVPARRLFEAMGARVSYDADTRTLRATKPGSDVSVRAGSHSVLVDGQSRPLDVAPAFVGGILYVPIRVISEGLGAYVSWIPERRLVSIRYIAPSASAPESPPPTPAAPTSPPLPATSASPASVATTAPYVRFVAVDLSLAPRVANEFTPHLTGRTTQSIRFAFEYRPLVLRLGKFNVFGRNRSFVEGEYQRDDYPHDGGPPSFANGTPCAPRGGTEPASGNAGCVTPIGGVGSAYVHATRLREETFSLHQSLIGYKHYYVATGLFARRNQYGYPTLRSNFGIGLEALPDLSKHATLYGSALYYPEVTGFYTPPAGTAYRLRYKLLTYRFGGTIGLGRTLFLDAGYVANHYVGKQNAPSDATQSAAQLGFGLHF